MSQNPEWKEILVLGFFLGVLSACLLSYFTSTREIKNKRIECELNIPRNQNCVMQFVPEIKK